MATPVRHALSASILLGVGALLTACGSDSDETEAPTSSMSPPAAVVPNPASSANPVSSTSAGTPAQAPADEGAPTQPAAGEFDLAAAVNQNALRNCGNENEAACGLLETDFWNSACDTGLQRALVRCGCLVHGPFGGCLVPQLCDRCINDTRRRPSLNSYAASWTEWAIRNQRDQLAKDEPINWVTHLGTHNAFNTVSDGFRLDPLDPIGTAVSAPNHFYSMTDQLRTGSRVLALDLHWADDNARLCHGGGVEALCLLPQTFAPRFPAMRYYANGIKEIRNWLNSNPDGIIIVALENYVGPCGVDEDGNQKCLGDASFGTSPLEAYLGTRIFSPAAKQDLWPSRRELLDMGKRVIVIDTPVRDGALEFLQGTVINGSFETWFESRTDFSQCKATHTSTNDAGQQVVEVGGPAVAGLEQFSVVVEDRTLQAPITGVGTIGEGDVRAAAECNYSIVFLDFISSLVPLDVPSFGRQQALVWSWKENDRGQNGDCAKLEAASSRWVSASCTQVHPFACGRPRSESGLDRTGWLPREADWQITSGAGAWAEGPAMCASEHPGYVFSVPVNGYQNAALKELQGAADVWLHYTDQKVEGAWEIPSFVGLNARPIANAGPDQALECGGEVTLDGSGSTDADGDELSYEWTGPFGTLSGAVVKVTLAAGTHAITLDVSDGKGGTDADTVEIVVTDTVPPTMSLAMSPSQIWPPNHQLIKVTADLRVEDACGADDVVVTLKSVSCDEPANGAGDGNTEPDIEGADIGTGDLEFLVRAERSAHQDGRTYTATYEAVDGAGNTTEASAEVKVAHDQR